MKVQQRNPKTPPAVKLESDVHGAKGEGNQGTAVSAAGPDTLVTQPAEFSEGDQIHIKQESACEEQDEAALKIRDG